MPPGLYADLSTLCKASIYSQLCDVNTLMYTHTLPCLPQNIKYNVREAINEYFWQFKLDESLKVFCIHVDCPLCLQNGSLLINWRSFIDNVPNSWHSIWNQRTRTLCYRLDSMLLHAYFCWTHSGQVQFWVEISVQSSVSLSPKSGDCRLRQFSNMKLLPLL